MAKKSKKSVTKSKSKSSKDSAASRGESAEAAVTAEREALARRQLLIATLKAAAPTLAEELGDMNEAQLRERLRDLDDELQEYKELVEDCKKENEDLRQEIEDAQRDSAEYTAYLLLKRAEKQAVIDRMQGDHAQSLAEYQKKRAELEIKLSKEAQDLTEQIAVLQEKLDSKNQEIVSLSNVLHQRQRHETQLTELKSALESAQATHTRQVLALERTLLEERVRVQRRNAARVAAMQAAAQHQALTSLAEHTSELSSENERMAAELKEAVAKTQAMQRERARLEDECKRLEREVEVRERVARVRPGAVAGAVGSGVLQRVRQAVSANAARESLRVQQERDKLDTNNPARRIRELSGGKAGNAPEGSSAAATSSPSIKSPNHGRNPGGPEQPPSSTRSQRRSKSRSLSLSGTSDDSYRPAKSAAGPTQKGNLTSLRNLVHRPSAALPLDIALDPIQFASDQRLLEKVSAKTAALMPGGRSKSPALSLPKVRAPGGSAGSSTCSIPGVIDDD